MGILDKARLMAVRDGWDEWAPGKPLLINRVQWGADEAAAVLDVFNRDWLAQGYYVDALQRALGERFGGTYYLTNSGSAALEIAVMTLLAEQSVKPGDIVLHPALTFNTSATCFAKFGMRPLFVDSEPGTYNADPDQLVRAMRKYPVRLIVLPYILGNMTDLDVVRSEAVQLDIPIIGDSCDTLGSTWRGREVGSWAQLTAYSFYASHHITTAGVGGALRVDEPEAGKIVKSLIYWGRDWEADQRVFQNRYSYATLGGDYQMTEMQAAFGLAQFKKLDAGNRRRQVVWNLLYERLVDYAETHFVFPEWKEYAVPSWFGFPLTVRDGAPFSREQFIDKLLAKKIECRPMFSGNTLRQKAWAGVDALAPYPLPVADKALKDSFFLPAWAMPDAALEHLIASIVEAVEELTQ